jgi:cytochrome P450
MVCFFLGDLIFYLCSFRLSSSLVLKLPVQLLRQVFAHYICHFSFISFQFAFQKLSTHQHIQSKLRDEVLNTLEDILFEELMSLPYLDAFVREILRVDAPVPEIYREVIEDDIIPTSMPSYDAKGRLVGAIPVKRGQVIVLPLLEINRSVAIWGPTARQFDPDRWLDGNLPQSAQDIHSFNNLVTFADGCVGYGPFLFTAFHSL